MAHVWLIIGLVGQFAFAGRFLVQWIKSEQSGKSTIPIPFWYLSVCGGILLLAYAIHKKDIVFILGQSSGLIVYVRNLMLIKKSNGNK